MLNTKQPFVAPFKRASKENEGEPIFIKFVLDGSYSMERLHGLLSELRSQYTGFLRLLKIDPVSQAAQPDSLLAHMLSVSRCIEPVRHAFNDDELIYCDYRRHTECHPTQASYGVRMTKSRKVNDRHGVPSLDGREFTVNELTAAPGVMGKLELGQQESFEFRRLEYPQYTRPREWEGRADPRGAVVWRPQGDRRMAARGGRADHVGAAAGLVLRPA